MVRGPLEGEKLFLGLPGGGGGGGGGVKRIGNERAYRIDRMNGYTSKKRLTYECMSSFHISYYSYPTVWDEAFLCVFLFFHTYIL